MKHIFLIMMSISFLAAEIFAQSGIMRGKVVNSSDKQALPGVNIIVMGTDFGAASDENGEYFLSGIPAGYYAVRFSFIGFEPKVVTDIFIRGNKAVYVNIELNSQPIEQGEVTVTSGYFEHPSDAPLSLQSLNFEEIRRAPGAREDVSRMIQNFPGVSMTQDDRNDLIVRGGSPSEVLFMIDGIEVPNPNHFGTQGSTGGPISMINSEFIDNAKFYLGGFNASYGDKISGVMDINYREGIRNGISGKVDLNFGGAGGYFEGGFDEGKGSILIGAHRSFLDLLESVFDIGGVPIYNNVQTKIAYDINNTHKVSFLFLGADDKIDIDKEIDRNDFHAGVTDTAVYYDVKFKSQQLTGGINLRSFWDNNFYTDFIVSHSYNKFTTYQRALDIEAFHDSSENKLLNEKTVTQNLTYSNISTEQISNIKLNANYVFSKSTLFSLGVYFRNSWFDYSIDYLPFHPERRNEFGILPESYHIKRNITEAFKYGGYINLKQDFGSYLVLNLSARVDHNKLLNKTSYSPRVSLLFKPTNSFSIHTGYGRYYQSPELLWIAGDPLNEKLLKDFGCDQFLSGITYLVTPATKLTVEGYYKKYFDYPVADDEGYEMITMANAGATYGNSTEANKLLSKGEGKAFGLDFSLQQKLVNDFYGMLSYSFSDIKHKAKDVVYRRSAFDKKHVLNLVFGYRINKEFELSCKWRYAGGSPYTPYDSQASIEAGEGILDLTKINESVFPSYSRFDIRLDHREYYESGTLVEYISIENVFGSKNVLRQEWNRAAGKAQYEYQMGFFIVGGISYEF